MNNYKTNKLKFFHSYIWSCHAWLFQSVFFTGPKNHGLSHITWKKIYSIKNKKIPKLQTVIIGAHKLTLFLLLVTVLVGGGGADVWQIDFKFIHLIQ